LRLHRQIEVAEAVLRDEQRVRQIEERRHARAHEFVALVFGPERAQHDFERVGVCDGQVLA
jgi:hypothetical protein